VACLAFVSAAASRARPRSRRRPPATDYLRPGELNQDEVVDHEYAHERFPYCVGVRIVLSAAFRA
jgi:hypothetical protein